MCSPDRCTGSGYHLYNFDLYRKGVDTLSRESSDKVNKEVTRQFKEGMVIDEETPLFGAMETLILNGSPKEHKCRAFA